MDDPMDDKLFEPTVDMMVNDFDDEATMEEEENLITDPNQVQNELDNLQREGELPIEELLRLYNCPPPMAVGSMHGMKSKKPRKRRKHFESTAPPPPVNNNDEEKTTVPEEKIARLSGGESELPDTSAGKVSTSPAEATTDDKAHPVVVEVQEEEDEDIPAPRTFVDAAVDDQSSSQPTDVDFTTTGEDLDGEDGDEDDLEEPSELVKLLDDVNDEEEEADYDYYPDETDFKKCILVGDNHQAVIPEIVLPASQQPRKETLPSANSSSDQLLWSPHSDKANEGAVERFLASFYKLRRHLNHHQKHNQQQVDLSADEIISRADATTVNATGVVKDEESALLKLLEADYNVEVALQQVCNLMLPSGGSVGIAPPTGTAATTNSLGYSGTTPVDTWTEEECRNFELGIRLYGKNFALIQQTKVTSRSVPEIVQFYYFWKKTERYDSFAAKQRLEKKKHSNQNPGLTEYMDKFLEEQRSISPRQTAIMAANTTTPLPPMMLSGGGGGSTATLPSMMMGQETESGGVSDGNHSLLIYADSKRHRTSGGSGGGGPLTPPVNMGSADRHPLEELAGKGNSAEVAFQAHKVDVEDS